MITIHEKTAKLKVPPVSLQISVFAPSSRRRCRYWWMDAIELLTFAAFREELWSCSSRSRRSWWRRSSSVRRNSREKGSLLPNLRKEHSTSAVLWKIPMVLHVLAYLQTPESQHPRIFCVWMHFQSITLNINVLFLLHGSAALPSIVIQYHNLSLDLFFFYNALLPVSSRFHISAWF